MNISIKLKNEILLRRIRGRAYKESHIIRNRNTWAKNNWTPKDNPTWHQSDSFVRLWGWGEGSWV